MAAKDAVNDAKEAVEDVVTEATESAKSVARKVSKTGRRLMDDAEDVFSEGQDALESALICAKDVIRQHPITTVVGVAAIAYLLGKLR